MVRDPYARCCGRGSAARRSPIPISMLNNMKSQHTKILSTFLLICIINYSCTFTYVKSKSSDIEKYYSKINSLAKDDIADVYLMNGNSIYVENLIIRSDSTSWVEIYTEKSNTVLTDDVNEIVFKDHLKGTIGGFIGGFLAGVALSVSAALLLSDDGNSEGGGGYAIIGGTMLGTLLGTVIGAIKGDKQVYVINPMSESND